MTTILDRAARALCEAMGEDWDNESSTLKSIHRARTRAVLMAVRSPDEKFMMDMYPDPKIETADRGRRAGARSRSSGKMQIAHFVDTILNEEKTND